MSGSRYLVTQTLLSAWLYQYNCAEGWEDEAREDFLKKLRKEECEQTDAMLRGISFEDAVQAIVAHDDYEKANEHAKAWAKRTAEQEANCVSEVASVMRGATYQLTAYKEKTIGGENFLLMAKCDWVKAGVIYDCKRIENYQNVGKYFESVQHPMYLEVIDTAKEFRYVICDGIDVYEERYTRQDIPQSVDSIILQFVSALKAEGLWETYKEKWKTRR